MKKKTVILLAVLILAAVCLFNSVYTVEENEYGSFLALEPLTLVPYDRDAIDLTLLTSRDVELMNDYHAKVYAAISPYLAGDELAWLKEVTAPVTFG